MEMLREIGHRITEGPTLGYAILILALILAPRIAEVLRLPAMVGLVLAGMALGPHGAHVLATKEIALSALGEFGLLYLMFSAGLELDLKLFMKMKRVAITFALLSFAFPFTLGVLSAKLLSYKWAAAVLMGSNWGSHTLVTYPMLRQMGLSRNRAVATVVGATAVTDTSALLVLSVVSGVVKPSGSLGVQLVEIAIGLALLATWSLLGLPRVARWFFARVGTDRAYRFVFGIGAFLVGGVLAEAAGIDGIVGAFFAGLGLNRAVPEESPLMDRLQFMGSTLFIPIFLVSVGVLLEPKVMVDPKTLLVALVFTVAVLGGKALAAVVAGRTFHFTWPEVGVMSGLSGSQAAATLATTLVGAKLGLFDTTTINAVLVVILAIARCHAAHGHQVRQARAERGRGPGDAGEDGAGSGLGRSERRHDPPGGAPRDQRRRHRPRGQLRKPGDASGRAEDAAAPHDAGGGVAGQGRPRVPDGVSGRADGPRGSARDHPGRGRDAAGHRVAHARADRARQRGVRGARALAGADPDGARRRRVASSGCSSSCAATSWCARDARTSSWRRSSRRGSPGTVRIGTVTAALDPVRELFASKAGPPIGSRPPIRSTGSGTTSRRRISRSSPGWTPRGRRWRASPRWSTAGSSSRSPRTRRRFTNARSASPARWWWVGASSRIRPEAACADAR